MSNDTITLPRAVAQRAIDVLYELEAALAQPATQPTTNTVAISAAIKWISSAPHGDNCYVSDNYEGDPGNCCRCGKESILAFLEQEESAGEAQPATQPEAYWLIAPDGSYYKNPKHPMNQQPATQHVSQYEPCYDCGQKVKPDCWRHNKQPAPDGEPVGEVLNARGEFDWSSFAPPAGTSFYTTLQPRKPLTTEAIRAAGGIVHSDGNIFFTNIEQLNKAITGGQA